jgi:predicted RNA-binding protein with RPS1 domain
MIHISKFGVPQRVANVNDVAKVWEIVKVKVYAVDKEKGRIGLEKLVDPSSSSNTKDPAPPNTDSNVVTAVWEG